jgi:hypothetical protein
VAGVDSPAKIKASPTATGDQAQLLPATAEEWSAFDLIVIGDVPTEFLPPETQRNIAKAVRDRGTTLLVVAGQLNMPARYTGSPLAELLPVHLSSNWSVGALADHMRKGFKPEVAPEGVNSIFSKLDLEDTKNAKYWTAMGLDASRPRPSNRPASIGRLAIFIPRRRASAPTATRLLPPASGRCSLRCPLAWAACCICRAKRRGACGRWTAPISTNASGAR